MPTLDELPPQARFLIRATDAGLTLAEAALLLGTDESDAAKRLRIAASGAGIPVPPSSEGGEALVHAVVARLQALAPDAVRPSGGPVATPCPPDHVVRTFALGRLTGPHVLVTAEHAADCRRCLERVLAARRAPTFDHEPPPPGRPTGTFGGSWRVLLVVVGLIAAAIVLGSLG